MPISPQDAVILRQAVERQLIDLDTQRAELQSVLQRLNGSPQTRKAAEPAPRRTRRRKMTAAQRKAVSERMKKYWAARGKKR